MSYYSSRMEQAPIVTSIALHFVQDHATTPTVRDPVCNVMLFMINVLWVQLDALYHAYVDGHIPPGAFVPAAS